MVDAQRSAQTQAANVLRVGECFCEWRTERKIKVDETHCERRVRRDHPGSAGRRASLRKGPARGTSSVTLVRLRHTESVLPRMEVAMKPELVAMFTYEDLAKRYGCSRRTLTR